MRFVYAADLHYRGNNPRSRTDDFRQALTDKLHDVFDIARDVNATAIIQAGDVFDRPEVSNAVLLQLADLLLRSPVPIYATYGQHDVYSYNSTTYERTSLAVLERLVPHLTIIKSPEVPTHFEDGEDVVELTFTPHSKKVDVAGYGYSPEVAYTRPGALRIHVAHGMLLDHVPPFDHYSLVHDVPTAADLVLSGDYHPGYGIYRRPDGKVFCNPGALPRMSASTSDLERPIQVAVIETRGQAFDIHLVKLPSAKPGPEVLDRSAIEAEQARQYAMDSFAALIKGQDGQTEAVSIDDVVRSIAKRESLAPEIVQLALSKIEAARALIA